MVISDKASNNKKNIFCDANTLYIAMEKRKILSEKNQLNKLRDLEKNKLLFLSSVYDIGQSKYNEIFRLSNIGELGKTDKMYLHKLKKQNKLLEKRIGKLENILVSGYIPKNAPRPYFDEITKRAVENELIKNLYKPLTKGIAFSSGFFGIISLIFISGLLAIPLLIFSGFFGYIYLKLKKVIGKPKESHIDEYEHIMNVINK